MLVQTIWMQIVRQRPYRYCQRANGERIDWIPTAIEGYATHSTSTEGPQLYILLCGRHQHQRIQMFWIPYVTFTYRVAKISLRAVKQISLEWSRDDKRN